LNHQLYLVTRNSLAKFFKALLYAVRVTRVENELLHSARCDYGHKEGLCLLLQRVADDVFNLTK